jgi:hypothetical protein
MRWVLHSRKLRRPQRMIAMEDLGGDIVVIKRYFLEDH